MNKAFILEEIQRTAKANGGVPLGWRKFEQETGIKQSEWWAKFWPRWSDALREAGFKPNLLTSAYDKTELIRTFATLAKELGKIPTSADLRFKTRQEGGFPSQTTFENRFDSVRELVKQVREYYSTEREYQKVVRLCDEYLRRGLDRSEKSQPVEELIGFVYLVKSGRFYKIGKTNAAGRREREIALQLPEKAATIHAIRTDDPSGIESSGTDALLRIERMVSGLNSRRRMLPHSNGENSCDRTPRLSECEMNL
jgi:hypothetical protein